MCVLEESILAIKKSDLFKDFSEKEIELLLTNNASIIKSFSPGMRIISEEDVPNKIMILISGKVIIAKDSLAGKRMLLASIENTGELFGEVFVFMDMPCYAMYAEAEAQSKILFIFKSILEDENEYSQKLIKNLMSIFAKKAYSLNQKLKIVGAYSLREKISRFLIDRQNSEGEIVENISREKMAEYLNVARPSLSRELGKMAKENIIKLGNKKIKILNQTKLEEYI